MEAQQAVTEGAMDSDRPSSMRTASPRRALIQNGACAVIHLEILYYTGCYGYLMCARPWLGGHIILFHRDIWLLRIKTPFTEATVQDDRHGRCGSCCRGLGFVRKSA